MKKNIFTLTMVATAFVLPVSAFALGAVNTVQAATYGYVNTSGSFEMVTANSAAEALTLPMDIAPHSGVILLPAPELNGAVAVSVPLTPASVTTPTIVLTPMTTGITITATSTNAAAPMIPAASPMLTGSTSVSSPVMMTPGPASAASGTSTFYTSARM